jgi:CysZ protein
VPISLAAIRAAAYGFGLPLAAGRLLLREQTLWAPALMPIALSMGAVAGTAALVLGHAAWLYARITFWMPALEPSSWLAWLWVGPALAVLHLAGALAFLLVLGICLALAFLVASLLAAPFHDLLSQRVERVVTGRLLEEGSPGLSGALRDAARALFEEARRVLFFLALLGPLVLLGGVLPLLQIVTGPLALLLTVLFLPLDYASYTLDRRRYSFRDKRRWIRDHAGAVLGFGAAGFSIGLVPVLNFAAMPLLVVSGTLLVLRLSPPGVTLSDRVPSAESRRSV